MISKSIRETISDFEEGQVFRLEDLDLARSKQNAAVVALGRMVRSGTIERLSPGTYYKPKRTRFGVLGPTAEEQFRDLLYDGDHPIGYLTGYYAFNLLGLTTQQSSIIEIGTQFPRRSGKRGIYVIRFVLQKNPITKDNIDLLRLLDCLKWIKKVPDTTVDRSYRLLRERVVGYPASVRRRLTDLALNYSPLTRALLGSMLPDEELAERLRNTLSPLTRFRIGLSPATTSDEWNLQ